MDRVKSRPNPHTKKRLRLSKESKNRRIFRWFCSPESADLGKLRLLIDAAARETPTDIEVISAKALLGAVLNEIDVEEISAIAAPLVVDYAVRTGRLGAARRLAIALRRKKKVKSLDTLVAALTRSPTKVKHLRGFRDDTKSDFQEFHRRNNANEVMFVCFTGVANYMFAQINALHPWFREYASHIIYLRDRNILLYQDGVRSVGGREQTVARIKDIAHSCGAKRIVCIGTSGGSFGALQYAPLLNAQHVICLAGPSNLELASQHAERKLHSTVITKLQEKGVFLPDLREVYAQSPGIRVRFIYGADRPFDAEQAQYLEGLPSVELVAIEKCNQHNVLLPLLRRNRFSRELRYAATGRNGHEDSTEELLRSADSNVSYSKAVFSDQ